MPVLIALIIFILLIVIALSIAIPLIVVNNKYKNFVIAHSQALKKLEDINKKYSFNKIKSYDQSHSYDNENYYDTISPEDYLIYQLVYIKDDVIKAINAANENDKKLILYKNEIETECKFDVYDVEVTLKNREKLKRYERKFFIEKTKYPMTSFSISVYLELDKINGAYVCSKTAAFYSKYILGLIQRVKNKSNGFYLDENIWKSICRVERGKVTNKLRFAIYDRDGWRCRKCGRRTDDLEIDHIVPIAKGGKTRPDNLQTLCRRCNKAKGATMEVYYNKSRSR